MENWFENIFIDLYDNLKSTLYNDIKQETFGKLLKNGEYDVVIQKFSTKNYINNIINSYTKTPNARQNIWTQFDLDCNRTNILFKRDLTERRINQQNDFIHEMTKIGFDDYVYPCANVDSLNMVDILGMLCNQSSYAFSYSECHNQLADPDNNIFVFNSSSNRYIRISVESGDDSGEGVIGIHIGANFKIMNPYKNVVLGYVETCITIDASYDNDDLVFYDGIFEWSFI